MRRRALTLFAGILVLGLMPGPALAGDIVDQSNEGRNYTLCGPGTFAQTVTVGQTGKLTSVDLFLYEASAANTKVSIYDLDFTGKPTGLALASATVAVSTEDWYRVTFATQVKFNSGWSFAIVFPVTAKGCAFGSSGTYPGGHGLEVNSGSWANVKGDASLDFAFRTYVEAAPNPTAQPVPTPTPGADSAPSSTPTPAPTAAPKSTPAPTAKPTPTATATATPLATASPTASDLIATPTTTDTASPTASASASPSAQPGPPSGGSGDSGGPPIVLVIVGIVALAAVLGGGIGLGFVLARRPRQIP